MSRSHRVAVSGCGAVTELYYVPVLRALERRGRLRITHLYDPDDESFGRVASALAHGRRAASFSALLEGKSDLVIVASPPKLHAAQSIAALDAGAAVLCEKPLALTRADASAVERAARSAARFLAVGMVRRRLPAALLVKDALSRRLAGAPRRFDYFEGGPFRWPVRSAEYFDREQSGGGVLIDMGSHVLDLVSWWFGSTTLRHASDDAMGGVEANALLELECEGGVEGSVRLSRDWQRPNELVIRADHGTIRWSLDDLAGIEIEHLDGRRERVADATATDVSFESCFAAQLGAVLDRLDDASAEIVEPADILPTVAVIEEAYATRTLMPMPWMSATGR